MASNKGQTEWIIRYDGREGALSALYRFLHFPDLNNPEITFFHYDPEEENIDMLCFSRDGHSEGGFLPGPEQWAVLTDPEYLVNAVAVASTDSADARRVALGYSPDEEEEDMLSLHFPNAGAGLTPAEKKLLSDMQAGARSVN